MSGTHIDVQRYFDRDASGFADNRWFGSQVASSDFAITKHLLWQYLAPTERDRLLEMGCGPGVWAGLLAGSVSSITALDISREMLEEARGRVSEGHVSFVNSDILDYEDAQRFDKIYSVRAIEYIEDSRSLIRKLSGLLNPGGRVVIISKPKNSLLTWRRGVVDKLRGRLPEAASQFRSILRPMDPTDLTDLFLQAGFAIVAVAPVVIRYPIFAHGGYQWFLPGRWARGFERRILAHGNRCALRSQGGSRVARSLAMFLCESYIVVADKPA